jgi:hypothetical protein
MGDMQANFSVIGALAALAMSLCVAAAPPAKVEPSHPLVGVWQFQLPDGSCTETYLIRADGTTAVTSGAERSESAFEISPKPSAKGFYRWTDRVTRTNGKPDCGGGKTPIGQQTTLYVRMSPRSDAMILCADESLERCIGPLVRMQAQQL